MLYDTTVIDQVWSLKTSGYYPRFLFGVFMALDFVSVLENDRGQYPAILTLVTQTVPNYPVVIL